MRCEELKSSQYLLDFLYDNDAKSFAKIAKDAEKLMGPKKLDEYITASGLAKVQVSAATTQFSMKMPDYVDSYRILYQELIDCSAEVH